MAYSRTDWVTGVTPLSATNLNNIEDGIEELYGNLDDFAFISSADSTTNNNIKYRGANIYSGSGDNRYIVFAVTYDGTVGIWGVNTVNDGAVKEHGTNSKGMSVFFSTASHALCLRVTNATSMSYKIIRVK